METKFLNDGRKVVVCGKINQTEYIVQEVFVTKDGSEIPSGENFTTKNLHDVPVESYKQREEKAVAQRVDKAKSDLEKLEKQIKDLSAKREACSEWIKRNNFLQDNLSDFDWEYFSDVMPGKMKYAVRTDYSIEVSEMEKVLESYDRSYYGCKFDGIKALSVVYRYDQKSGNRKYQFQVGHYQDGSGGYVDYHFCRDDKELEVLLKEHIQIKFEEGRLTPATIKSLSKYINIDRDIVGSVQESHNKSVEQQYQNMLKQAEEYLNKNTGETNE